MHRRFFLLFALALSILGAVIVSTPPDPADQTEESVATGQEGAEIGTTDPIAPAPPAEQEGEEAEATLPPPESIPGGSDESAPTAEGEEPASLERADALFESGDPDKLFDARRMYTALLRRGDLDETERKRVLGCIASANDVLFWSPTICKGSHAYVVQPGDALSLIAHREGQAMGVIMAANNITNPNRIRVNQRLKIIEGKMWVHVDTDALRLSLLCDDALILELPVCIGSYGRTPKGRFHVETRLENPDWYTPDGGVIRYGEPGHALGTRWLGFRPTAEFQGYGIHGTNEPETVPGAASAGCLRLRNEDVERLYPLIPIGTMVVID